MPLQVRSDSPKAQALNRLLDLPSPVGSDNAAAQHLRRDLAAPSPLSQSYGDRYTNPVKPGTPSSPERTGAVRPPTETRRSTYPTPAGTRTVPQKPTPINTPRIPSLPRSLPQLPAPTNRGGIAGNAALGGAVGAAWGLANGQSPGEALGGGVGGALGGGLGTAGGAALGSLLGPGGTYWGGQTGGLLGGAAGTALGSVIGRTFWPPENQPAPVPYQGAVPGVTPPFTGGQEAGRLYRIDVTYSTATTEGNPCFPNWKITDGPIAGANFLAVGPITGVFIENESIAPDVFDCGFSGTRSVPKFRSRIVITAPSVERFNTVTGGTTPIPVVQGRAVLDIGVDYRPRNAGVNVRRSDNQPDTAGNPPPLPVVEGVTPAPFPPPVLAPPFRQTPQRDDEKPDAPRPLAPPERSYNPASPPSVPRPGPDRPSPPVPENPAVPTAQPNRPAQAPHEKPGGEPRSPNLNPDGIPQPPGAAPVTNPAQSPNLNPDGIPRPGETIEDSPNVRKRTFGDPNRKPGESYDPGPEWNRALSGAPPVLPLKPPTWGPAETISPPGITRQLTPEERKQLDDTGKLPASAQPTRLPSLPGQLGTPIPVPIPMPVFNPNGVPSPAPAPPVVPPAQPPRVNNPCGGSPCGQAQLARVDALDNKLTERLGLGNAAGQAVDLALLNTINTKLGDPVPGGISGALGRMQDFAAKAWQATQMDKVLNLLTFVTSVHNAAMLSSNLGSTLSELTGLALQTIGIKDEEGSAINVGAILGKSVENLVKGVVGEDVYNGTKTTWNKLNRIVQTASQVIWTVRSMADSAREVTEWTAENTGKIGNALKRWGIVGENAYKWMPERVTAQNKWTRQVDRFKEGISGIDDAASSLTGALSEVRSIQEEANELKENKEAFDTAIKEAIPKDRVDNDKTKEKADQAKTASQSPDVSNTTRDKGDAP